MALMSPLSFSTWVKHSTVHVPHLPLLHKRKDIGLNQHINFYSGLLPIYATDSNICCGGWHFIQFYFCAVPCSTRFSSRTFTDWFVEDVVCVHCQLGSKTAAAQQKEI